jgi:uncharacterized membrane protein YeaQ/YmgE (transglycosylase-associated protein family)
MGIISWIILGAIAGWVASKITGRDDRMGCLANLAAGVAGAFIGGAIVSLLTGGFTLRFDVVSFIVAIAGAVLVLAVVNFLSGRNK